MPKRPGGLTVFDDIRLTRGELDSLTLVDSTPAYDYFPQSGLFHLEELQFLNKTVTVIDGGTTTGGWFSVKIAEFPATGVGVVYGGLYAKVYSVTGGISASGSVNFGIGSEATIQGGLSGAPADCIDDAIVSLTAGAGSASAGGPTIPNFRNGVAATENIYLNVGVLDADITADGDVTFDLVGRFYWLNLTRGL
jgi:hypothetical protein